MSKLGENTHKKSPRVLDDLFGNERGERVGDAGLEVGSQRWVVRVDGEEHKLEER